MLGSAARPEHGAAVFSIRGVTKVYHVGEVERELTEHRRHHGRTR